MRIGQWEMTEAGFGLVHDAAVDRFTIPSLSKEPPKMSTLVKTKETQPDVGQTVHIPPVRSQIEGSCYCFSVAHLIDIARPEIPRVSGLGLGFVSQYLYGHPNQKMQAALRVGAGGHVRYTLGALLSRAYGAISLEAWPDDMRCYKRVPDLNALTSVTNLDVNSIYRVSRYEEAQDLVKRGIPSVICTSVYDEVYRVTDQPTFCLSGEGNYVGEHAWVLVGPELFLSSWGKWGLEGLGVVRVTRDYADRGYECYALV